MTFEMALVFLLLIAAITIFSTNAIRVDITTLMLLIILMISEILTIEEAFTGFSSDFIIILISIFIISGALRETGSLSLVVTFFYRIVKNRKKGNLPAFLVMLIPGSISAFMNNTTVTALFIVPVIELSRKLKISPSVLLMPLAFATMLGGTCTLIGTSTNIAASGYIGKSGMEPIRLFELLPIGIILFISGIIYMMSIGKKLLPEYKGKSILEKYPIREYFSELIVMPGSKLIGKKPDDPTIKEFGFQIIRVIRGSSKFWPWESIAIQENDTLLVKGKSKALIKTREKGGVEIKSDLMVKDTDLESKNVKLAEVLISHQSEFTRDKIKNIGFRRKFNIVILAVYRSNKMIVERLNNLQLKIGDVILVQGTEENLHKINTTGNGVILEEFVPVLYKKRRGLITISAFIAAVILGGIEVLPLAVSFLTAAVIAVLSKSIDPDKVYEVIDWKLIILIGGMTAFGTAMEKTGAAAYLANMIVTGLEPFGLYPILAGFIITTVVLTQPLSNAAAALVMLPIAIETAIGMEVSPRTVSIMIMLAASISFITPLEPAAILVYGAGKYKFADFLKVGSLITFILIAIILLAVPLFWEL